MGNVKSIVKTLRLNGEQLARYDQLKGFRYRWDWTAVVIGALEDVWREMDKERKTVQPLYERIVNAKDLAELPTEPFNIGEEEELAIGDNGDGLGELPAELPAQAELPAELPAQAELPAELPAQAELPAELPGAGPAPTTRSKKSKKPAELPGAGPAPTTRSKKSKKPAELPVAGPAPTTRSKPQKKTSRSSKSEKHVSQGSKKGGKS